MTHQVVTHKGEFPHVEWVNLREGTLVEVAVVNRDNTGNIFFIELNKLDAIDRQRLFNIIRKRHAATLPLWDLMASTTLGNGMNALDYFHQLVKVLTPSGRIIDPKAGIVGARAGVVSQEAPAAPAVEQPK